MQQSVLGHHSDHLIKLFNGLFAKSFNTLLVGGGSEPLYRPAKSGQNPARIEFVHDYYASALHEIAHWCLAGEQRRKRVDYGYWYHEDGRAPELQAKFEQVEVKPQALEWVFSAAAGTPFRVSLDNLNGSPHDEPRFRANLVRQARNFMISDMPARAALFMRALLGYYSREISERDFCLENL